VILGVHVRAVATVLSQVLVQLAVHHQVTRVQVASGKVTVLFHVGVQVTRATVLVLATQLNVACHCNELLVQRCKLEDHENLADTAHSCHATRVRPVVPSSVPSHVHTHTWLLTGVQTVATFSQSSSSIAPCISVAATVQAGIFGIVDASKAFQAFAQVTLTVAGVHATSSTIQNRSAHTGAVFAGSQVIFVSAILNWLLSYYVSRPIFHQSSFSKVSQVSSSKNSVGATVQDENIRNLSLALPLA
jgi:hypothetical protein